MAEDKCSVGNLARVTEENDLEDAFREFGKILEAKIMKDPDTGMSRRFGFVTFDNEESMCPAIAAMNGTNLEGNHITVNVFRPGPSGAEYKCSVDNLSSWTDNPEFHAAFSQFGVIEANIMRDPDTGRSRGFGFVTFASKDSMDAAIKAMNGKDLDGCPIRVNADNSIPGYRCRA